MDDPSSIACAFDPKQSSTSEIEYPCSKTAAPVEMDNIPSFVPADSSTEDSDELEIRNLMNSILDTVDVREVMDNLLNTLEFLSLLFEATVSAGASTLGDVLNIKIKPRKPKRPRAPRFKELPLAPAPPIPEIRYVPKTWEQVTMEKWDFQKFVLGLNTGFGTDVSEILDKKRMELKERLQNFNNHTDPTVVHLTMPQPLTSPQDPFQDVPFPWVTKLPLTMQLALQTVPVPIANSHGVWNIPYDPATDAKLRREAFGIPFVPLGKIGNPPPPHQNDMNMNQPNLQQQHGLPVPSVQFSPIGHPSPRMPQQSPQQPIHGKRNYDQMMQGSHF